MGNVNHPRGRRGILRPENMIADGRREKRRRKSRQDRREAEKV